jgi:tRNA A37 N6-isopentenylltransferase MiaA
VIVEEKVKEIHAKNKIAIIEGGSGFYLKYLLTSDDI